ncbi:MAG: Stp1/IreP family PP2C-type Ser/Thr phosphatase [Candidatus Eiseniibacteriota bacterium]|jgi:protein phosphatase
MSEHPEHPPSRLETPSHFDATVALADEHELVLAGRSDIGCRRANNEDAHGYFVDRAAPHRCLLVVCDGMGGASAGEVASATALAAVRDHFLATAGDGNQRGDSSALLTAAIQRANHEIHERSQRDFHLAGMGTTCTAALLDRLDLTIGHVGDSRAYVVRTGIITQLTRDHSLAEAMRRSGEGDEERTRNARNILTRSLGNSAEVNVDIARELPTVQDGDVLVLCSDGLSNPVRTDEICAIVSEHEPGQACRRLIELARERGGPDNITVIVARVRRVGGRPDGGPPAHQT